MQVVLGHALGIGGNGGALYGYAVFLGGLGSLDGDAVAGLVALREAEVEIFSLKVDEGVDKLILDHFPQDAGHLVAIHLDDGVGHFDFFHGKVSFL